MPALFTSTSMPPKRVSACSTAADRCSGFVTSSVRASAEFGKRAARSLIAVSVRAPMTTRSPFSSTYFASANPRPLDAPVMSHILDCCLESFSPVMFHLLSCSLRCCSVHGLRPRDEVGGLAELAPLVVGLGASLRGFFHRVHGVASEQ